MNNLLNSIQGADNDSSWSGNDEALAIEVEDNTIAFGHSLEAATDHLDEVDQVTAAAASIEASMAHGLATLEGSSDYAAVVKSTFSAIASPANAIGLSLDGAGCTVESANDYYSHDDAKNAINSIEVSLDTITAAIAKAGRIAIDVIIKLWKTLLSLVYSKKKQAQKILTRIEDMEGKFEKKNSNFMSESIGNYFAIKSKYDVKNVMTVLNSATALVKTCDKMNSEFKSVLGKLKGTREAQGLDLIKGISDTMSSINSSSTVSTDDGWGVVKFNGFVSDKTIDYRTKENNGKYALKFSVLKSKNASGATTDSSIDVLDLGVLKGIAKECVVLANEIEKQKALENKINSFGKESEAVLDAAQGGGSDSEIKAGVQQLKVITSLYSSFFKAAPAVASESMSAGIFFLGAQLGQYKKS